MGLAVACAGFVILQRARFDDLAVRALWVRVLGLVVLAAASMFTVWARLAIGDMWSVIPKLQGRHQLRTDGPYAVTRHPIYTGMLAMPGGTGLLVGDGRWLVPFPVFVVLVEIKRHIEERLMLAEFPTIIRATASGYPSWSLACAWACAAWA